MLDIECIWHRESKGRMAARFFPKANPHVTFGNDSEVRT